jgi:hypothetical protein
MILGWGHLHWFCSTGNLEDTLKILESGQRVAADWAAAVESVIAFSLSAAAVLPSTVWEAKWMEISWDAEAQLAELSSGYALELVIGRQHTEHRGDVRYITFSHSEWKETALIEVQCFEVVWKWKKNI